MVIWHQFMHISVAISGLVFLQQERSCENEIHWSHVLQLSVRYSFELGNLISLCGFILRRCIFCTFVNTGSLKLMANIWNVQNQIHNYSNVDSCSCSKSSKKCPKMFGDLIFFCAVVLFTKNLAIYGHFMTSTKI